MLVLREEEGLGTCSNHQEAPPGKQEGGPELSSRRGKVAHGEATHPLEMESEVATRVGHELFPPLACLVLKKTGGWGTSRITAQAALSACQGQGERTGLHGPGGEGEFLQSPESALQVAELGRPRPVGHGTQLRVLSF